MKSNTMPSSITIRDIPDSTYQKLKERAELHRRSINSEIIMILEQTTHSHPRDPESILLTLKKLHKRAKGSLSMDEIQDAIDEGRK